MAVLLQLSEGIADRKGRGHDWIVRILHPPHAGDAIQDRRRGEQPHGCSRPRQRRRPGPGGARGPAMALPRTRRSAHWPRGEGLGELDQNLRWSAQRRRGSKLSLTALPKMLVQRTVTKMQMPGRITSQTEW